MAAPHTSTVFLHTSLLSAMLGASIGFAIQVGLENPTPASVVAIVVLVLHAVNFYHGKTVGLQDVNELIRADARPIVRGTLLFYNTLLFLTFCVMAGKIESARFIAWGEVVLRVLDITGVAAQLRIGDRSPGLASLEPGVRSQLQFWQTMNATVLVVFAGVLGVLPRLSAPGGYRLTVIILTVVVSVDLLVEYTTYSVNYFGRLDDWNSLAERWDRLQGVYGDRFRQGILHPFLGDWLAVTGAGGAVDLGAGNGCTVRWLADFRGLPVVGVDGASDLVDLALLYQAVDPRPVRYLLEAIDGPASPVFSDEVTALRTEADGAPLAFYSMFAAQDCADLAAFFAKLAALMAVGERMLVVFESAASFNPLAKHSTTVRTWKYSLRTGERLQVVSWLPVAETDPTSMFAAAPADSYGPISVVTHFRTFDEYKALAEVAGFEMVSGGIIDLGRPPTAPDELSYARNPKFEFVDLRYSPGGPRAVLSTIAPAVRRGRGRLPMPRYRRSIRVR
jgi:hypothetical protein